MFTGLIQVILLLGFVTPCESDVCSQKICQCTEFGRTQLIVKCRVHGFISTGIPSNTRELDLPSCPLSSITEDIFRNLTVLEKLDLSNNSLRHIPQHTFRNMEKLKMIYLSKNLISGSFYLPENVSSLKIRDNLLSTADVNVILKGLTRLHTLDLSVNPLGPSLPSDIFAGLGSMKYLSMTACDLENIVNGTFRAMRHLQVLDLSSNKLTRIHRGTMAGLTDQLKYLFLQGNELETIGDGVLEQFKTLELWFMDNNKLTSVPDLTGPKYNIELRLGHNRITDLSRMVTSGVGKLYQLLLDNNEIDHLPENIFQSILVFGNLDLSFNNLQSLPDNVFAKLDQLNILMLTFNRITHINKHTFSGLSSLTTLLLHSNAIKTIESKAFDGLVVEQLTIFDNPFSSLPDGIFDKMTNHTKVSLTCKNLRQLPRGKYVSQIECAPSTSLYLILDNELSNFRFGFSRSGFVCHDCATYKKQTLSNICKNCSLCPVGTYMYTDENRCVDCPAGNENEHLFHR